MGMLKIVGEIGKDVFSKDIVALIEAYGPDEEIEVLLLSPGGDIDQGLEITNALQRHPGIVTIRVEVANSIAASIAQAASSGRRIMASNGEMIIHLPMVPLIMANELDLDKIKEFLQIQKTRLISTFKRTGLSINRLGNLLDQETYLDAESAKKLGFIDEIDENLSKAVAIMKFNFFPKKAKAEEHPEENQIHSLAEMLEKVKEAGVEEEEIVKALAQFLEQRETKNAEHEPKKEPEATEHEPKKEPVATQDDPETKALIVTSLKASGQMTDAMDIWAKDQTIKELTAFAKVAPKVVSLTDKVPDFKKIVPETPDEIKKTGSVAVMQFDSSAKAKS